MSQPSPQHTLRYQLAWNRLLSVVEEQAQVLIHTAFGTPTREAGDLSAGVFLPDGRMVAQAVTGTPVAPPVATAPAASALPVAPPAAAPVAMHQSDAELASKTPEEVIKAAVGRRATDKPGATGPVGRRCRGRTLNCGPAINARTARSRSASATICSRERPRASGVLPSCAAKSFRT